MPTNVQQAQLPTSVTALISGNPHTVSICLHSFREWFAVGLSALPGEGECKEFSLIGIIPFGAAPSCWWGAILFIRFSNSTKKKTFSEHVSDSDFKMLYVYTPLFEYFISLQAILTTREKYFSLFYSKHQKLAVIFFHFNLVKIIS